MVPKRATITIDGPYMDGSNTNAKFRRGEWLSRSFEFAVGFRAQTVLWWTLGLEGWSLESVGAQLIPL